jgi:uncharacterized tellurite resistance protein B-like protein
MLERWMATMLKTPPATADTVGAPFARRDLAAAVLLLEVAQCDRGVGPEETTTIERIVRERLGAGVESAKALIAAARTEFDASLDDWIFAAAVREGFDPVERIAIVGEMWDVVYVDGHLEGLEEAMMQRLGGELGIADADFEAARAQAFARHGPPPRRSHEAGE